MSTELPDNPRKDTITSFWYFIYTCLFGALVAIIAFVIPEYKDYKENLDNLADGHESLFEDSVKRVKLISNISSEVSIVESGVLIEKSNELKDLGQQIINLLQLIEEKRRAGQDVSSELAKLKDLIERHNKRTMEQKEKALALNDDIKRLKTSKEQKAKELENAKNETDKEYKRFIDLKNECN